MFIYLRFQFRERERLGCTKFSNSATKNFLPRLTILCPSALRCLARAGIPPGYFSLSWPPSFRVRQYGVILLEPSAAASSAALAAIQAKIPVVMGQPIVARCLLAREERIWLMVVRRPRGTRLISASTSLGEGMTTVPLPQRALMLGVIGST